MVTKLENSKCDKTQLVTKFKFKTKHNLWKTQIEKKKLKLWQNSSCDKTQIVTKFKFKTKLNLWKYWNWRKNSSCDKTQIVTKFKLWEKKSRTQLWQNSDFDKNQELKFLPNSKTQIVTKLKYSNWYKTWNMTNLNLWRQKNKLFWKEQFDTFDSRCVVLRAAFCDSRDVFLGRGVCEATNRKMPNLPVVISRIPCSVFLSHVFTTRALYSQSEKMAIKNICRYEKPRGQSSALQQHERTARQNQADIYRAASLAQFNAGCVLPVPVWSGHNSQQAGWQLCWRQPAVLTTELSSREDCWGLELICCKLPARQPNWQAEPPGGQNWHSSQKILTHNSGSEEYILNCIISCGIKLGKARILREKNLTIFF